MNILVTGGAGYIGSVLVPLLLEAGHRVTVLDNFMWRQNSLAHVCHNPRLWIVCGDARRAEHLERVPKFDVVIPLAAIVGAPACSADVIAAQTTNADAVQYLCNNMVPSQRLVIPISNSGYGVGEPGKECTEESPLRPVSLYGRTKVEAEQIAMRRENSVSLRLATLFGMSPRMRLDLLVNDFVHRAVNDRAVVLFESHFKRNYLHVRDAALALALAADGTIKPGVYNAGLSDANLSKRELCEAIARQVPGFAFVDAPIGEDPDKRDYVVSNAKLEATGWRPRHSLPDGIRELVKGCQMLRNGRYGNA